MNKALIIDGNSILNRAFYGISGSNLLKTRDGIFTNAIYGFLSIMLKVISEENPEHICVSFDLKAPTFRHIKYDQYKAQRKGMPEELAVQMPLIKEVLAAMNIPIVAIEGYEADDVIGTLATKLSNDNHKVVILTGDKDSFQLVNENINIKLPHTRMGKTTVEIIDVNALKEKYNLLPEQMIHLKALMGDTSDNIPGVPGVGEKTALDLIQRYGDIYKLYEFIENNPEQKEVKGKLLERLVENKESALLSLELGTICLTAPVEYSQNLYKMQQYNYDELYLILKKLELKTFIDKFELEKYIDKQNVSDNLNENETYNMISSCIKDIKVVNCNIEKDFEKLCDEIEKNKEFSYYFTDKLSYEFNDVKIFSFFVKDTVYNIKKENISEDIFVKYFKEIFENSDINKIGFDTKKDCVMLNKIGIKYNSVFFDCCIAEYLLEPSKSKYILEEMLNVYLNIVLEKPQVEQMTLDACFCNTGNSSSEIDTRKCICYGIYQLKTILNEKLEKNNQSNLFYNIEMKLVSVLANMEYIGIQVDTKILEEIGMELNTNVLNLEKEIYTLADCEFNINSPKQLGEVLFEKLRLPVIKKNKTGYSTDVDVLEKLKQEHKVVEKLLEYRQLMKLKTTYVDGLKEYIKEDKRVHSKLLQTVVATGRLSSIEPNMQNIPVRSEAGRQLRKIFIAKPGCSLIDADYSQIELRVLAHISNDEVMIKAFNENADIHTSTAMQVFDLKHDEVTSTERSAAKAVNFGIVYGISDYGLSQTINKSVKEAKTYIDRYLEKYSGIKKYMHDIIDVAKEQGYVETLFNRRRYIDEVKSKNYNIRQFGERIAMNTPIQGTAADIIKIAMINVYEQLKEHKLKSELILQVHDELIIEAYDDEIDQVKEILRSGMEQAMIMKVPLKVDMKVGHSWYETK